MNADDTPQNLGLVPMVIETSGRGERAVERGEFRIAAHHRTGFGGDATPGAAGYPPRLHGSCEPLDLELADVLQLELTG